MQPSQLRTGRLNCFSLNCANIIILRFFSLDSFSTEKEMKAILLFTAALFAVSSALPFYENLKNQQTSNLCVSLSYSPSSDTAFSYVHVCNTPGEGKYAQSFPIRHPLPARLFVLRPHVFSSLARLNSLQATETGRDLVPCYSPFLLLFAGTCVLSFIPRCTLESMKNPTRKTATIGGVDHEVLFSTATCEPGRIKVTGTR